MTKVERVNAVLDRLSAAGREGTNLSYDSLADTLYLDLDPISPGTMHVAGRHTYIRVNQSGEDCGLMLENFSTMLNQDVGDS